jgi:hypothetical protein
MTTPTRVLELDGPVYGYYEITVFRLIEPGTDNAITTSLEV